MGKKTTMRAVLAWSVLAGAMFGPEPAVARKICVEKLAGVCLKYEEAPERAPVLSPAAKAENALRLTRPQRMMVQQVLKEKGHYSGSIDGAFGPMSRRALRNWQQSAKFKVTGYLTASQIRILRGQSYGAEGGSAPAAPKEKYVGAYIVGKSFDCAWEWGAETVAFSRKTWTGSSYAGSRGGAWEFANGYLELVLATGRFRENGRKTRRERAFVSGETLVVGTDRCRVRR